MGGLISLTSRLYIKNPYITIAGQTAPGDGICIRGGQLSVNTHDVIIRYIRSRAGDNTDYNSGINPDNRDCFEIQNPDNPPYNVIFDHCSASWGIDETMSTWYPCRDITIQWCILAEGLHNSLHSYGAHGKGLLIGDRARGVSILNNLFANNFDRNPTIKGSTTVEFNNNIVYGWGSDDYNCVYIGLLGNEGHTPLEPTYTNVIGNTFQAGPSSFTAYSIRANGNMDVASKLFIKDNIGPGRTTDADPALNILRYRDRGFAATSSVVPKSTYEPTSRTKAYDLVLSSAGAILPKQDAVDTRIINDVKNNTGKIINSQSEVGGYATYNNGIAYNDTDKDGMPNDWEAKYGFNPENILDGNEDADKDGYTNIEEFLNGTEPKENITSIEPDKNSNFVVIYPNPANLLVTISKAPLGTEIKLLDLQGRELISQKATSENTELNLQALPQGLYLLKVGNVIQNLTVE